MKLKLLWLIVSITTFVFGLGIVSFVWFSKKVEGQTTIEPQINLLVTKPPLNSYKQQKTIKAAWKELTSLNACLFGWISYSPKYDETPVHCETCAFYNESVWIEFRKRDKREAVPFLLQQLNDRQRTHLHVDPFDNALKNEFAVYCLQYFLKTNWRELKEDYRKQLDNTKYPDNHQEVLRRILKNKNSREEMRDLWMKRFENSVASENSN